MYVKLAGFAFSFSKNNHRLAMLMLVQSPYLKHTKGEKGNESNNELSKTVHCEICNRAFSSLIATNIKYFFI